MSYSIQSTSMAMAKMTASSYVNPYIPPLAANGILSEGNRWLPDMNAPAPHWLQCEWPHPRTVTGFTVYLWFPVEESKVKEPAVVIFDLQVRRDGQWLTVKGSHYSGRKRGVIHRGLLVPVEAEAFRLYFPEMPECVAEWQLHSANEEAAPPAKKQLPALERVYHNPDYNNDIRVLVSQYGYHPEHRKEVIYQSNGYELADTFAVRRAQDGAIIYSGQLRETQDDFGTVHVGDFSSVTEEGEYYVAVGKFRSVGTFRIRQGLWDEFPKMVARQYFGLRRIGEDNIMGNLGATVAVRWDDAVTKDGSYVYIGKGFADGDDLRRYANGSLIVAQYCLLERAKPTWNRGDWLYEQVRWGLDGTLSFLGKNGLLKYALHGFNGDSACGTDGIFESGDEGLVVDPFNVHDNVYEYNDLNREIIYTSLLLGPAEACLEYRERDPEFFGRVLALVVRGYEEITRLFDPFPRKYSLSAWIWLNTILFQLTGEPSYKAKAIAASNQFIRLQVAEKHGDDSFAASGWYRYIADPEQDPWRQAEFRYGKWTDLDSATRSPWGEKPEQEIMLIPWIYQGLFRAIECFKDAPERQSWIDSITAYGKEYLERIASRNVYGLTPMKVASKGLIRQIGNLSFQYHAEIGRAFHQLGNAALLMKTGKLTGDSALQDAAWKQLQYFSGVNPFGVGMIFGISSNIPSGQYHSHYSGRAFPGGTVNGFNCVSADNDYPNFQYWEYYGYANLACLWMATEIVGKTQQAPIELWPRQTQEAPHSKKPDSHYRYSFPVRFKGGFAYRFEATVRDDESHQVSWLVNGVEGGSAASGLISKDGVFQAPFVLEEQTVVISAQSVIYPHYVESTPAAIMPVPKQVEGLRLERTPEGVLLNWEPLACNTTGYTVWRRLPAGKTEVGTIFERIGVVHEAEGSSFLYREPVPAGTEFLVRGYHRSDDKNYGYGQDSKRVRL